MRPLTLAIADRTALLLLVVAVVGGIVAQALFVGEGLGPNVGVWSALVLGAAILVRRRDVAVDRLDLWLPPAALLCGAFVAIRGDGALLLFNTLASWALLIAAVAALRGVAVTRGSLRSLTYIGAAISGLIVGGAARLGGGLRPLRPGMARQSTAMRVLAGLALALPLVLVFSALFAAADAVFAAQLGRLLVVDVALHDLIGRALFAFLAGWVLAGLLLVRWLSDDFARPREGGEIRRRLGVVEASIPLIAVDAVFAFFVVLQAAYLFGGLDTLAASGMTYSEYARRGFFELIAVAGLAGLLLFNRLRLVPRVLLMGALLLAVAANVVGPQRFVTEQNLARAIDPLLVPADGRTGLDVDYLSYLGDEAVPLLVGALPQLPEGVRANLELALGDQADRLRWEATQRGWPSFNLARARALEALAAAGY